MFIKVNGETVEIDTGSTIEDLLNLLKISKIRLAVELNGHIIPNSKLLRTPIHNEDVLEIVKAIGGG